MSFDKKDYIIIGTNLESSVLAKYLKLDNEFVIIEDSQKEEEIIKEMKALRKLELSYNILNEAIKAARIEIFEDFKTIYEKIAFELLVLYLRYFHERKIPGYQVFNNLKEPIQRCRSPTCFYYEAGHY